MKLAGKEYSVRQLSVRGLFHLVKVLNKAFDALDPEDILSKDDATTALLFIVQGLPEVESDAIAVLADVLDAPVEEVGRLPVTGMIKVIRLMIEQEDVGSLFFECRKLANMLARTSSEEQTPSPA